MATKVLHIFYNSLPNISGASTRNRDIVNSQKETMEIIPYVITAPFQEPVKRKVELLDGVPYIRTQNKKKALQISEDRSSVIVKFKKFLSIFSFFFVSFKIARKIRPEVIHAHSMFYCGITAYLISKFSGTPYIYEVRSLWEERNYRKDKSILGRIQLKTILFFENFCMRNANHLIVINKNLKKELESRIDVVDEKISVINNAVKYDSEKIDDANILITKPFDELVFGYIGTVAPIEGLIYAIKAFQKLKKNNFKNKFLIYGNGKSYLDLKKYIEKKKIDNVELKGFVSNDKIKDVYDQIDVILLPRVNEKITNQVTPLKPLEAMANLKLVMGSNVGGLLELVNHNVNGLIFKSDSVEAIYDAIVDLSETEEIKINTILKNAYHFVLNEKSWKTNALAYYKIYKSVENGKA